MLRITQDDGQEVAINSVLSEIIQALLDYQDDWAILKGRRATIYIDYAPGQVKLRLDKLGMERAQPK